MKIFEITDIDLKKRWKPRPQAYYFIGAKGNPINPEDREIIKKHVKHIKEPKTLYNRYIVKYNPEWYEHTRLDPRIKSFEDLLDIVKKYFEVGTIKPASTR